MPILSVLYVTVSMILCIAGCGALSLMPGTTIHQRCGWKAEDYFTDPKVIALCHAIEASNLAEMDRLVKAGEDVNAQGKGKMTPLLWAFPDNNLPRFKWMLEHGANPNVVVEDEFNTGQNIARGDSVTQLACESSFPGYFETVFDHGGDPNLRRAAAVGASSTPLHTVIQFGGGDRRERVKRLIELGGDMNALAVGATPVMTAVGWGGQYDLAIMMLEAGADHRAYEESQIQRLIHRVVREERRLNSATLEQKAKFHELVKWLEDHGESYAEAKKDRDRWDSWSRTTGEFKEKMDAEIAERKAREKAAAEPQPK